MIPVSAIALKPDDARKPEDESILRAKSFLFFYGLEERYGRDNFNRAFRHMLSARRGRGFDLDDLIAAFEEETHQNVAEFVRLWMKHPGVPEDFRSRFQDASSARNSNSRENAP
jgi:aminopeptidase N